MKATKISTRIIQILWALLLVNFTSNLIADELILKDGTSIEWIMLRDRGTEYLIETPRRKRLTIPKEKVDRIVIKKPQAPLTGATVGRSKALKPPARRGFDILKFMRPKEDAVSGTWRLENGVLVSGGVANERIEIPYEPPEEYDFTVEFRITGGVGAVVQILSAARKNFWWEVAANNNKTMAFGSIDGKPTTTTNPTMKSRSFELGRKYVSTVKIRKGAVSAYIDGELVARYETDFGNLTLHRYWMLRSNKHIGVGCLRGIVEFHRIEIVEVTGTGRLAR